MTDRTPATPWYDAVVDLGQSREAGAYAYAIAKVSYSFADGRLQRVEAEPLAGDMRDPDLDPRLPADTDFWSVKDATDFVVRGAAFAPSGRPAATMRVSAQVGTREKHIHVFGDRAVEWTEGGDIRFGDPEPFVEMPLTWERAYGGIDWRVPVPNGKDPEVAAALFTDHPGMYPRNPFGRGYLVESGEVEEMLLPNLENPADLLTPGRLLTGDPRSWWGQPVPWCFDWTHPATFPRICWLGQRVDAWYPAPQGEELTEVRWKLLPQGYRDSLAERPLAHGPHPWFRQGGSAGFILQDLRGGEPVRLSGMHPDRPEITFALPVAVPALALAIDGAVHTPEVRLHHVVCHPAEERVDLVYAVRALLPRLWIPGVHKHIPVAVSVDGDAWIEYAAPVPALEALARAQSKDQGPSENAPPQANGGDDGDR